MLLFFCVCVGGVGGFWFLLTLLLVCASNYRFLLLRPIRDQRVQRSLGRTLKHSCSPSASLSVTYPTDLPGGKSTACASWATGCALIRPMDLTLSQEILKIMEDWETKDEMEKKERDRKISVVT